MGQLKNTFLPMSMYNQIPFIHHVTHVAETHADDLECLKVLLRKHNIPPSVCIKLIHIHFHLDEGEIMVFREFDMPQKEKVPFLGPMLPDATTEIYGCHYIVDDAGDLQAFEYTAIPGGVNLVEHPAFVAEFCATVVQRGIQRKFGLAIKSGIAARGYWTELDYPEKRATFLLPSDVPLPESDRIVRTTTKTQFSSDEDVTHIHVEHTWGTGKGSLPDGEPIVDGVTTKGGFFLTGIPVYPDTAFYGVVSAISVAV
ncbi:Putative protein of unknown function [Podospora comata]|uniref:Uncharacterized protein n=1 Tax=Podospora comata TaxID=48703 RepID=A0ABY6S904_PODCO|nr:Putative protein of unknown function [Podospora comata]